MVNYRIRYVELIVLLFAVIGMYLWSLLLDSQIILSLFWVTCITMLLPIMALLRQLYGISVSRKILHEKKRYYTNDDIDVQIKITNRFYIPTFFPMVLDPLPKNYNRKYPKEVDQFKVFPLVIGNKKIVYTLRNVPRGPIEFRDIKLLKSDLLGFVDMEKILDLKKRILVYPKYVNLKVDSVVGNQLQQQGVYNKYMGRETSQITGVREYQRGDKLSLIHWKATARKRKLMSKEFAPYLTRKSNLILNCYNEDDKVKYDEKFELAVSVAATLVNSFGHCSQPFAMKMSNNERFYVEKRSKNQFLKEGMQKLALVQKNGQVPISAFCKANSYLFEPETMLFIVTTEIDAHFKKVINQLSAKRIFVKVFLVGANSEYENAPYIQRVLSLNDLVHDENKLKGVAR
ncbi:DUF58 domain-containing protein [Proteinivorax hydrogeniformans]|uniref:DUF58 domain-containing protein n=1 Tax=Proteinivorax hydrogeniformans TaxID=1826727 RepID=A0AAU8HTF2_9FIRM